MREDIHERLQQLARDIVEDTYPLPRWTVGDVVLHPDGYPVLILSGALWREYPDGGQRLENQWTWQRVDSHGQPFGTTVSGQGWAEEARVSRPSFGH